MKNLVYIALLLITSSCSNNNSLRPLETFENVEGVLYYEKPENGSVVDVVFIPEAEMNIVAENMQGTLGDLNDGIKFGTTNGKIKDVLYMHYSQKAILKGVIDRDVFLVPNAKIYFHIEKQTFTENSAIDKEIRIDTLIYKSKTVTSTYRYSYVVLDSIKVK